MNKERKYLSRSRLTDPEVGTVTTCVGKINPKLYGDGLQNLCRKTHDNLNRLSSNMADKLEPCLQYGIKHWHPSDRPKSAYSSNAYPSPPDPKQVRWHDTNIMFTDSQVLDNMKWPTKKDSTKDDESDSLNLSTGPKTTFCYICSTLEEHKRHLLQYRPKRPVSAKPRIEYVAPKPRVKQKMIEEAPNIGDHLYRVDIYTGDKVNAGTTGEVFITIKGSRDVLYRTKLSKKTSNFSFMRNTKESFFLKGPRLGNLEIITIEHEGGKRSLRWFLDRVEITDMKSGMMWVFKCQEWFDSPDSRDLIGKEKEQPIIDYDITVHTGTKSFGGTDANIYLTIYGARGQSPKIHLVDSSKGQKCFEKGSVDKFRISQRDLGELKKIRIEHDGKGVASGWHLEKITIATNAPKQTYYFLYGGFIGKDVGKGHLYREIFAKKSLPKELTTGPKTTYMVTVQTGDVKYAGTDANVFIQICGKDGRATRKIKLDDSRNNFERGAVEQYKVEAPDVGSISHIIVGHDNSGPGAGWFLDEVKIKRYILKKEASKYVKKEQDKREKKEAALRKSREESPNQRRKKRRDEDSEEEEEELRRKVTPPLYEECVFPCNQWLANDEGDGLVQMELKSASNTLHFSENSQEEKVHYTVIVHTGKVQYAGTDADVFIQIFGENGRCSRRTKLDDAKNNFEKGMEDIFELEDVNLGTLSHIVIGHDDSGPGSGWFLDDVIIRKHLTKKEIKAHVEKEKKKVREKAKAKHKQRKKRRELQESDTESEEEEEAPFRTPDYEEFHFPCNKWLDKKEDDGKIERQLKCMKKQLHYKGEASHEAPSTTYQIIVKTGKKSFAGTDANVYIQLHGKKGFETPRLPLDDEKNNSEKGQTDVFKIETVDVGPLAFVTVGHDGSGPGAGWFLDEVRVRRYIQKKEAKEYIKRGREKPLYEESVFPCNRWLSSSDDDKKIERQLKCNQRTLHYE
ncbi:lipoxygenase homology domain-containing protein 1-like [Saccostrea echinata]|uniref:lipoxygenase homology domain-containing protein 1-like n=1 Tax=Saccostrea echinata TaxID=191078 RepID=UPI002A81FFB7|nr:lipoxygenase homology domain-containing protein 1-like [Saccostrea echinata]